MAAAAYEKDACEQHEEEACEHYCTRAPSEKLGRKRAQKQDGWRSDCKQSHAKQEGLHR
jgi:hypothetical protein